MAGTFVISLDFELHWGVRDKRSIEQYGTNLLGVRKAIPAMLDLFREYDVHATWATVGFLFFDTKAELLSSLPEKKPEYAHARLSPYRALGEIGEDEKSDPYHFAPSLIRKILDTPGQELGTHTFSHYYCLEPGQDAECFKADLEAAKRIASKKFGIDLRSIVFPRNQFQPAYLNACKELGFSAYRGNLESWFFQARNEEEESLLRRSGRLLDSYLPLSGSNAYSLKKLGPAKPYNIPASRFLRPYSARMSPLEPIRKKRIVSDLEKACSNDGVFHLWWHPHNFGVNLAANIQNLREVLNAFSRLRTKHGMRSLSMGELADSAREV